MILDLNPYPSYRDSGVDWVESVPRGWEVRRLKDTVEPLIGGVWGGDPDGVDDTRCVRVADFDRSGLVVRSPVPTLRAVTPRERASRLLRRGDLLLEKSGGGSHQQVGLVVEYQGDEPAVSSNFIARMRPRPGFIPRYLTYLHAALYAKGINTRSIKQTTGIQNLDGDSYLTEEAPLAPLEEQGEIVRFLDHATSRVRRLISGRERLVELLVEEKQAIANEAVTRGLEGDSRLEYSGSEWIGDIPEGWRVMRLKHLGRIGSRLVDPKPAEFADRVLIAPNHVESGSGRLLGKETARAQGAESGKYLVRKGELVYSKIRPALRKAVISPVDGLCSADMYPIAVRHSLITPEFLQQVMLSPAFTKFAVDQSLRVAMPKVNREALGNALVPLPPLAEQRRIVEFVNRHADVRDRLIDSARRQMDLLLEYRSSLLFDVVTGKLDIRAAAERLPASPEVGDPALDEHPEEVAAR